jgi:hypothetical protein
MRLELILKSFEATGVWLMDAEVILKRFNVTTSGQDEDAELGELGDGDSWNDIQKILDAAVIDRVNAKFKHLAAAFHSLQVQNKLLYYENKGLCAAITTKQQHATKSKTLDLQQRKEYHGGAVLWSPCKLREARVRERLKQRNAEEL